MQTLSKRDKTLLLVMIVVVLSGGVPGNDAFGRRGGPWKNMLPLDEATAKNVKTEKQYKTLLAEKDRLEHRD